MPGKILFIGDFIDAPTPDALRVRRNAAITVVDGVITGIYNDKSELPEEFKAMGGCRTKEGQMIVPGLIDLHIHAPQFQQWGTKTDIPLMEWLDKYTYPAESAFSDPDHATRVYQDLVQHLMKNGITTACLYGSNHLAATKILAEKCGYWGIRALVGKTCADILTPEHYVETTEGSLRDTEEFVKYCHEKWGSGKEAMVKPVVTPRFIPTCSMPLLKGLGDIAQKYDCYVQSHAAESVDEEALVDSQYPGRRDVDLYAEAGLLGDKTILAHCCRLKDSEAETMEKVGSAVVSCPFSNILFARATVPIPHYKSKFPNLKIGLGTDIAGGFGTMQDNMRTAIFQDRVDNFAPVDRLTSATPGDIRPANWVVDFKYAFHLATAGGAKAIGMEDMIGKFEVGMRFDALLVDCALPFESQRFLGRRNEDTAELFEKWITIGDDRNVRMMWVNGKHVHGKDR